MEIFDVIKYEGDNETIIWKHPKEDFNFGSQLIVHESQEAIFFMDGKALDSFKAGKYTLETSNLPILSKLINIPTNGESQFHCEIYFINKVEHLAIKWGTDSKLQFIEPTYKFPLSIGANGEMAITISDARKLLLKLVGTETNLSKEKLVSYFKSFLVIHLKPYLSKYIKDNKINIFEIDEKLEIISNDMEKLLIPDFMEYGIDLKHFFITTIIKPDGDSQYEKFKELYFRQYSDIAEAELKQKVDVINQETEKKKMIIEAEGIAEKRKTEGYSYQEERGYDVAEKIAQNEGAGNFSSAGIGLGIMTSIGSTVNSTFGSAINDVNANQIQYCDNCGNKIEVGQQFCDNCGSKLEVEAKCKFCGYKLKKDSKYCPNCGKERS
ncbi:MAG TPA: SPFH domain-containing protein [Candidatus Onthousia excrementipullorum]|uniref:SPFH domain-containing protein n=1 Tax=Candidatus Onthousia excrementipullorum TaxID=2840884 RepID=A0A9D1J2W0_9FIRM|nr:SPFH domain-containing protein [Candidatus Onthousia excrementipullorum]